MLRSYLESRGYSLCGIEKMYGQQSSMEQPATPNNPDVSAADLALPTIGGGSKQGSLLEPSPTSTHGETEAGNSTPATPAKLEGM